MIMKKIVTISLRIVIILIILFLVTRIFKRADERYYGAGAYSAFSKGDAPDSTRKEVILQLQKFQDGYSKRDVSQAESFMTALYSASNTLILGTMPREIFIGYNEATRLVKSDWESWGDCRFVIDSASISSSGDVAWFSTGGYVKFDLSGLLKLPLRLTGVMVKEEGVWKFQQQQFQFDIDFSFSILATLLLFVWLLVSVISLLTVIIRILKNRSLKKTEAELIL